MADIFLQAYGHTLVGHEDYEALIPLIKTDLKKKIHRKKIFKESLEEEDESET